MPFQIDVHDQPTASLARTETGNSIVSSNSYAETSTSSITLTKSDTYATSNTDNQTVTTVGSNTVTGTGNSITGSYSLTDTSNQTVTTTENGTRSGNNYSLSSTDTRTASTNETGNNVTGAATATQTVTDTTSLTNLGNNGSTGSYTLTETDHSTVTVASTDNSLTGSHTQTTYATDTSSIGQISQNGAASFTLTSNETTQASTTSETGNNITGTYSTSTKETATSTLTQSGTNAGGTYGLTVTSTESPTITASGNTITGGFTLTQTGTQGYSFGETNASGANSYSLSETGSKVHTLSETASNVTGCYTLSDEGTDTYTLSETGTLGTKTYTQTVAGTDTFIRSESGNQVNAGLSRTVTTSGTDTVTEAGTNNGTPFNTSVNSSPTSSITETANYLDGAFSLTQTGTDRYKLLEQFNNTSNASASGALPGNLDYSPVGAPFHFGEEPTGPTGGGSYHASAIGATGTLAVGGDLAAAAHDEAFAQLGMGLVHEYCWRAGTSILVCDDHETPKSPVHKRIEDIRRGELVLCPSDHDPHGRAEWKRVEAVFHNEPAAILAIETKSGHVLYPTANHPIFVLEKGWTPAASLEPGDLLLSQGAARERVSAVRETGLVEPVYNLRVADNHTYFVSDGDPTFSVLAHNASIKSLREAHKNSLLNRAWNATTGFIEGLLWSGSKSAPEWKAERDQAAMKEQNGPIESWLPKAHEIAALPDVRTEHRKSQEAQRDAAVAQQPGGKEQLAREAQRLESRKNLADNVTAFTPGLNDFRDFYEFGTGKDFVRGTPLTAQQRNQTAMMSIIPGASGSEARKLDKALGAIQEGKSAAKEGADLIRPSTATTAPGKNFIKREHLQAAAGETLLRQSVEKSQARL